MLKVTSIVLFITQLNAFEPGCNKIYVQEPHLNCSYPDLNTRIEFISVPIDL